VRRLFIICAALLLVACEERQPLNRGQALSVAASRAEQLELGWGQPQIAVPPDAPDPASGRLYWQVRFADAADGSPRIMLVNWNSAWARPLPEGMVLRSLLYPVDAREVARSRPVRGTWILVIEESGPEVGLAEVEAQVTAWNELAQGNLLYPLFSRRPLADGGSQIIYGWHEEGGIPRIEGIATWVERRLERQGRWVDLADPR
jgi:hypothetical protein